MSVQLADGPLYSLTAWLLCTRVSCPLHDRLHQHCITPEQHMVAGLGMDNHAKRDCVPIVTVNVSDETRTLLPFIVRVLCQNRSSQSSWWQQEVPCGTRRTGAD